MSAKNFFGLSTITSILLTLKAAEAFINPSTKLKEYPVTKEDAKDPLFLTELIENGNITEAREKATVSHQQIQNTTSYSGYLTVNKEFNSNLFFWFFPAQNNSEDAPVLLWLQGGPGGTSMYGLLVENGPFSVTKNNTLEARKYSWSMNHNMIYIDSPVGTGYSFTDGERGYAKNQTDVGRDLLSALVQFFQLFPEFRKNPFFTTGESFAGKYVPAISHAIKEHNINAATTINLQGLAIGNGWTDPINQIDYGDFLYQLGLVDLNRRNQFRKCEAEVKEMIRIEKFHEASDLLWDLMYKIINVTGIVSLNTYLLDSNAIDFLLSNNQHMTEWIQQPDVQKALHVGNAAFHFVNDTVRQHLMPDIMQSVAVWITDLLHHYRVMHYNGQLDIVSAYPLMENYLKNLNWTGAEKYKNAVRKQWRVGGELAGYTKTVDNLTEVLVRNAGHMVAMDQPKWALDLITRFTLGVKF